MLHPLQPPHSHFAPFSVEQTLKQLTSCNSQHSTIPYTTSAVQGLQTENINKELKTRVTGIPVLASFIQKDVSATKRKGKFALVFCFYS